MYLIPGQVKSTDKVKLVAVKSHPCKEGIIIIRGVDMKRGVEVSGLHVVAYQAVNSGSPFGELRGGHLKSSTRIKGVVFQKQTGDKPFRPSKTRFEIIEIDFGFPGQ